MCIGKVSSDRLIARFTECIVEDRAGIHRLNTNFLYSLYYPNFYIIPEPLAGLTPLSKPLKGAQHLDEGGKLLKVQQAR